MEENTTPMQQAPEKKKFNGKGLAMGSLIVGIFGVIFCWVPGLNYTLGFVSLGLGIPGFIFAKKNGGPKGMAMAGIILGAITIIAGIIVVALLISAADSIPSSYYY